MWRKLPLNINFIRKVAQQLNVDNLTVIRGDALRYLASATRSFDVVFADPSIRYGRFCRNSGKILSSAAVAPGTLVIVEHNKSHDFSSLPGFIDHRTYGSVNFSIFRVE